MSITQAQIAEIVARVRARRPLVHHITNYVTVNGVANITLCMGALPVMAQAKEEVEQMVEAAGALVLNLGTLWPEQVEAMVIAGRRANQLGIPIILDPVGAGATSLRTESALRLLNELSIAVVRGNAAEMAVLAGPAAGVEAKIKGVESIGGRADPAGIATELARRLHCVAAVTGPVDGVCDGTRCVRVANGHAMMGKVTGTGCMATAVIGACAAVEADFVLATATALAAYGLSGERAAAQSRGPGTFQVQLLDALAELSAQDLLSGVRVKEERAPA
jgi:hydroxyethylthiazole kinase